MSRRTLTLLLATLLAVGLTLGAGVTPVPYVSLGQGPAYDTLGAVGGTTVITVSGAKTYPTDGRLDLTTVGVKDGLTLFEAMRGWLSPHEEVVPREVLFPPDQTAQQVDQTNAKEMKDSQDAATSAALRQLGLQSALVTVSAVPAGPATGKLQVGDVLTTVDGAKVDTAASLRMLIGTHSAGQPVTVGYTRGGVAGTAVITTVASTGNPPRPIIGVSTMESPTPSPIKVTISLRDVGGPSAGLMFTLGIIDKLGPDSLTGGRNIAGTGEITADGTVGEIGGIAEKLLGARSVGATVFLVPTANCPDAKAHRPDGLELVKVGTLKQALDALTLIRGGGTPTSC